MGMGEEKDKPLRGLDGLKENEQLREKASVQTLTLRRSSPWEMFSASMKADTRWWMGPASPQCGLSTNVWKPLCLGGRGHEDRVSSRA